MILSLGDPTHAARTLTLIENAEMKVNISYYLDEHGWSSCWIYSDRKS